MRRRFGCHRRRGLRPVPVHAMDEKCADTHDDINTGADPYCRGSFLIAIASLFIIRSALNPTY
jgi:hypothetical protein